MDLAVQCYELTRGFPREEAYGMTSQIRRAAASVPANIAEGYGRSSTGQYVQFLRNAHGSLREVETHILLAVRVRLASDEDARPVLEKCDSVGRMLWALAKSVDGSGMSA
ncbi:MAG: four helix bundle protein [Thermomicrobiales bacterium]|nr:four helix bundle protein [Thermomicrobiales bacterium]